MSSKISRCRSGWPMVGAITLLIVLITTAMMIGIGGSEGARAAIRFTARTSLILFLLTFTASALCRLWPGRVTQWLRQNRRHLGVSFAGSHAAHALAIAEFIRIDPVAFHAAVPPIGLLLNGIGYVFIIAMTATSFDRTAALVGPRAWRWLHVVGAYYIWFAFAKSYLPRAAHGAFYLPFAIVVALALGIRVAGSFCKGSRKAVAPAWVETAT